MWCHDEPKMTSHPGRLRRSDRTRTAKRATGNAELAIGILTAWFFLLPCVYLVCFGSLTAERWVSGKTYVVVVGLLLLAILWLAKRAYRWLCRLLLHSGSPGPSGRGERG